MTVAEQMDSRYMSRPTRLPMHARTTLMANRRVLRMSTQRITFSPYARARVRDGIFALSVLARFMTSFSPFCMGALFVAGAHAYHHYCVAIT